MRDAGICVSYPGMVYDSSNVPTDVTQLQQLVISLSQSNAELHAKLDKMTVELQRITRLFEKFFNKSSEKIKDKELKEPTADQTADDAACEKPKGKRGRKGGGGGHAVARQGGSGQCDG